jgi:hypothetical protein
VELSSTDSLIIITVEELVCLIELFELLVELDADEYHVSDQIVLV